MVTQSVLACPDAQVWSLVESPLRLPMPSDCSATDQPIDKLQRVQPGTCLDAALL